MSPRDEQSELIKPYRAAIEAIGRREHVLKVIYPLDWTETDRPRAMLVLVGGKGLKSNVWPAIALVFGSGNYALGRTIPGSVFPGLADLPRILEGHQCFLEVGEEVKVTRDVSTNGTFVIPSSQVRNVLGPHADASSRKQWILPCPTTVHQHDVLLTAYAEFVLVLL